MQKDIYQEYALLTAQIESLESKQKELKAQILEDMISSGQSKIQHTLGSFTVVPLKTWQFPEDVVSFEKEIKEQVEELEEQVKLKKEIAKSTNEAMYTEKESMRFTPIKI